LRVSVYGFLGRALELGLAPDELGRLGADGALTRGAGAGRAAGVRAGALGVALTGELRLGVGLLRTAERLLVDGMLRCTGCRTDVRGAGVDRTDVPLG